MSSVCSMGFELFHMRISLVNTTYKQHPAESVRNIISIYTDNLLNGKVESDLKHDLAQCKSYWNYDHFVEQ